MNILDCGTVAGTHGVRGEIKINSLLDNGMLETIKTLYIGGQPYRLISARPHKSHVLAVLEGVDTVEKAMALKSKPVTCDRDTMNLPQGHFFYRDIYGFEVFDLRTGQIIGTLHQVREAPAGMLYVIRSGDDELYIPAVDAFKRGIDFEAKRVSVETIRGMLPNED